MCIRDSSTTKAIPNNLILEAKQAKEEGKDLQKIQRDVYENIRKTGEKMKKQNKVSDEMTRARRDLRKNDKVRLKIVKKIFDKGYTASFSTEIYTIDKKYADGRFRIVNKDGKLVGMKYINELRKVPSNTIGTSSLANVPNAQFNVQARANEVARRPVSQEPTNIVPERIIETRAQRARRLARESAM